MPLAEIRDGVVIGMLVGRQEAKGHIFMGSGFDLARAIDPHAVAVKQEPQHHLWRIGRLAAAIPLHRTRHRSHQGPASPPHPPKSAKDASLEANRAAKAATAKPDSDRRSENSFP